MDDTTQKVLGFADYGEWWDEPGNALFTRRPSMINYDPAQSDSIFLAADTLWLYTIAVLPPDQRDTTATTTADSLRTDAMATDSLPAEVGAPESTESTEITESIETPDAPRSDNGDRGDSPQKRNDEEPQLARPGSTEHTEQHSDPAATRERETARGGEHRGEQNIERSDRDSLVAAAHDAIVTDSLAVDSIATDSTTLVDSIPTAKQLRDYEKMEKRRVRDSIRGVKRHIRDSIDSIRTRERDSIRHIRDSILQIKIDTIIAKRRAESARVADEEAARIARIKQKSIERENRKIARAKARAARRGKEYTGPDFTPIDSLADSTTMRDMRDNMGGDMADTLGRDSLGADSLARDSMAMDSLNMEIPFPADSSYKLIKAYRHVRMYRTDIQLRCDSLTAMNTDSIIRLYREPILWNESNQVTSDSMAIYTANEMISKAHFMGTPILGAEIDTMYYNQVKGKDMTAYFENGKVYRNDVDGNAQTIYFLQDEGSPEVTGLMYIESAGISFYLVDGEMDKITYKQNPEYVIYPMTMIPETQQRRLDDFVWHDSIRPVREDIVDRTIRSTRRDDNIEARKPRFRITERINYDRRRLTENRMWEDRVDELTPNIIEWRNSRPSYKKK